MTTASKAALASSVVVAPSIFKTASAAIPEGVTTALTTAVTDAATLGGAVLLVFASIVGFKYLRRAF